jgi:hypothetical protein
MVVAIIALVLAASGGAYATGLAARGPRGKQGPPGPTASGYASMDYTKGGPLNIGTTSLTDVLDVNKKNLTRVASTYTGTTSGDIKTSFAGTALVNASVEATTLDHEPIICVAVLRSGKKYTVIGPSSNVSVDQFTTFPVDGEFATKAGHSYDVAIECYTEPGDTAYANDGNLNVVIAAK